MSKSRKSDAVNVKSVKRTIEALKLFGLTKMPMSAAMVQHGLNIPQSSTWMLLKTLTSLGYLTFDPHKRVYTPTISVNLLGAWMQDARLNGVDFESTMQRLHTETNAAVLLGMQNGMFVRYIHTLQNPQDIRFNFPTGIERPIWIVAAGKALLSLQPDSDVAALVRRVNARGEYNQINLRQLRDELAECRRQGYSINRGTATRGIGAMAMVLPAIDDGPSVSLCVCGLLSQMEKQWFTIEKMMRDELLLLQNRSRKQKV